MNKEESEWTLIVRRREHMRGLHGRPSTMLRSHGKYLEDLAGQLMHFVGSGGTWDMKVAITLGDGKAIKLVQAGEIHGLTRDMGLPNLLRLVNILLTRLMGDGRGNKMGSGRILVTEWEA